MGAFGRPFFVGAERGAHREWERPPPAASNLPHRLSWLDSPYVLPPAPTERRQGCLGLLLGLRLLPLHLARPAGARAQQRQRLHPRGGRRRRDLPLHPPLRRGRPQAGPPLTRQLPARLAGDRPARERNRSRASSSPIAWRSRATA